MGRTGGGSSGGLGSSGGGHSFGVSTGGHRVGGGSGRTGAGSSYSRSSRPGMTSRPYHYHSYNYRRPRVYVSGGYTYYRNPVAYAIQSIVSFIMMLIILFAVIGIFSSVNKPANNIERFKLETGNAFDNNCIDDQLGWFDSTTTAAAGLKKFWEETGVQPYIIIKADDGTLTSDAEKEEWLKEFYNENIAPRQDAFVYCYFYENGEELTGVPNYMAYASGTQTSSVMDALAVDIFWGYIDRYWTTDMSTDEVFTNAFTDTGKAIMHVSTTGKDLVKYVLIIVIAIIVSVTLMKLAKVWFKDRREKAAEDERILKADIGSVKINTTQDLEDKYLE